MRGGWGDRGLDVITTSQEELQTCRHIYWCKDCGCVLVKCDCEIVLLLLRNRSQILFSESDKKEGQKLQALTRI